jgi:hypothetical protein
MDALLETGTRYEHWSELLDIFRQGVQVVAGMPHPSAGDITMRTKLENAIEMIERRLNNIAGLNSNFVPEWQMRDMFGKEDEREVTQ